MKQKTPIKTDIHLASFKLPKDIFHQLAKCSAAERRTMTSIVIIALESYFGKKNCKPVNPGQVSGD